MKLRQNAGKKGSIQSVLRHCPPEADRTGKGARMIDQEKVLRMTKMASYEEHGGKKDMAVAGYFRNDYIGMQMILSFVVVTLAFLAAFGAWLCFNFVEVMENIYSMDLVATGQKILLLYLIVLAGYMAVTWVIYLIRYAQTRKRLSLFLEYLNDLDEKEEEEGL